MLKYVLGRMRIGAGFVSHYAAHSSMHKKGEQP